MMKSIKSIFLSLTIMIIAVIVGFLSWSSYRYSKETILESVEEELTDNTILCQTQLDAWLENRKAEVQAMANTPIIRGGDPDEINAYLGEQLEEMQAYSSFWLSDMEGNWYSPLGTSGSISERDYFPIVVSTQEAVISNPLIGQADGKLAVVIAIPVKVNGRMQAILGANVKVEELVELVGNVLVGQSGYATLYQKDGTVIAAHDTSKILEYNPFTSSGDDLYGMEGQVLAGELGIAEFTENGYPAYIAHTPMNSTDWTLAVVAHIDEFMAPLTEYLQTTLITAVVLLVLSTFAVWLATNKVIKPLRKLQNAASLMADGDCTVSIKIKDKTEVGKLAEAFNVMGDNLRNLLSHIHESADQIKFSSEELSDTAEQTMEQVEDASQAVKTVAADIRRQVSHVERMADSANKITSAITHVNENITEISASADETVKAARNGNEVISAVKHQMESIKTVVSQTAKVIEEVGEHSRLISEIVDTIANISGQTNLLALNASIEAARAGEQGRGFAVVAQEVGKLAEESSEATKKISSLVAEMQESTEKAVLSMNEGTKEVSQGTIVVSEADSSFMMIRTLIEQLLGQLEEIITDMQNIGNENHELMESVDKIDELSRQIADQTQVVEEASDGQISANVEIKGAITKLAKMSEQLLSEVENFKLE
ncbi:MAG: methyl-accepting chemotaxis protein [Lachnospiraceae bacterium]|nr:methyl-accepting chemotaxis protein [Lachnospiraceae bacterium]